MRTNEESIVGCKTCHVLQARNIFETRRLGVLHDECRTLAWLLVSVSVHIQLFGSYHDVWRGKIIKRRTPVYD